MVRAVRSSVDPLPRSSFKRLVGWNGVRFSNRTLLRELSGESKLISPTFSSAKITLAVLRWADQAGNRVAGAQIETADLTRADVDIVRTGEIGAVGRAQEAEAVL